MEMLKHIGEIYSWHIICCYVCWIYLTTKVILLLWCYISAKYSYWL